MEDGPAGTPGALDRRSLRAICWILIICSVCLMSARLWQVRKLSYDRLVPFLSANDRSRWCTIRALGDYDTYAIDPVLQSEGGQSWDTIDKVMHWGRDFRPHFYSSKPPLLPTLLTYPYLAIKAVTGWTLASNTFDVVRWMLLLCQILPLVIYFWAIGRIAELCADSNWTRLYLMAFATFGTYITTFAVSLNNHVPAVVCVTVALLGVIQVYRGKKSGWGWFFATGLLAAFAAATELPAVSFLAVAGFLCLIRNPAKTLTGFLPGALIVAAAFFSTNHAAHNDWRTPYAHRSDGEVLATVSGSFHQTLDDDRLPPELAAAIADRRNDLSPAWEDSVRIMRGGWPDHGGIAEQRWIVYFEKRNEPIVVATRSGSNSFEIRRWNNWYEYPGSYWLSGNSDKSTVDIGEPDLFRYLVNLTVWHHGVFLLTPVWLLSIFGLFSLCTSRHYRLRLPGLGILAISIVVFAFYVSRPVEDRNYGGLCCAPRWLFWMAPLWMVAMIPVLDAMRNNRIWKGVAFAILAASIASASVAWANPWVHPWLYQWLGLS
jgi:hypothetical protein